jgi:hypothetical protein
MSGKRKPIIIVPPTFTFEISPESDESANFKKMVELREELVEIRTKKYFIGTNIVHRNVSALDPYMRAKGIITYRWNAENVTNAWVKMMQMLRSFELIKSPNDEIFCNAEMPGAFIFAINHYCFSKFGKMVKWHASSLIGPSDISSDFFDDEFGIMRKNPKNWLMTEKMNGDITVEANRKKIHDEIGGKMTLYTSDLGFHSSSGLTKEKEHIAAHIYAAVCGLESLAPGGSMVLKFYTFSEAETINFIMDALIPNFDKVYMHKPSASRLTNTESYVVCMRLKKKIPFATAEGYADMKKLGKAPTHVNVDLFNAAKMIYGAMNKEMEKMYNLDICAKPVMADIHKEFSFLKRLPNDKKLGLECPQ